MTLENCLICKKHKENVDIIYKDDIFVISHYVKHPDKTDNYLGYYMIESIRHFKDMYDASDKEMEMVGKTLKYLSQALKVVVDAENIYSFIIGEGVDHFHIHVIARYKNAPREYWGPSVDDWPKAPRGGINEIRELNNRIKKELKL